MENFTFDTSTLVDLGINYGVKLVQAVLVLVIGLWITSLVSKLIKTVLTKSQIEDSLNSFIRSLVSILLKVMVYITALGMLGVEMTSFIAILGAAGLAVGMALSGTLQNFAGGVMILLFKPFKVGDFIEAQGYSGSVQGIQIFVTSLNTPDNKTIIIPNGPLSTGSLINYSAEETRRVDWTFGIGYGDDIDKAYQVLRQLIDADERILKDPEPFMALSELADSSVNIVVRVWVKSADYWGVFFKMNEEVYKTFDKKGLSIPFPQTELWINRQE
ncbi:MAG: mechanosensitive ion channel [Balneolales bacterium]|nr:mechanosensitive ion channel [Balneolales bacterium]